MPALLPEGELSRFRTPGAHRRRESSARQAAGTKAPPSGRRALRPLTGTQETVWGARQGGPERRRETAHRVHAQAPVQARSVSPGRERTWGELCAVSERASE